jgi:DNA-binding IclR family transcriptional regulator
MQQLHRVVHDTVYLAVRDENDAVGVEKICGHWRNPVIARIGHRRSLHTTSLGMVLLAAESREFFTSYYKSKLQYSDGAAAQECFAQLWTEICSIREKGFAASINETLIGPQSVAVPIYGHSGVIAALGATIQGEPNRWTPYLMSTASDISKRISFRRNELSRHDWMSGFRWNR